MPATASARALRLAPLFAALAALTACASSGGGKTAPTPQVNALYAQLDQASKGYDTAVQQAREGNAQASQQTLSTSLEQLKHASAQCGNSPGCDPQRFFAVYDRLLRLKDGSFSLGDDVEVSGEQSPEGNASAGKTGAVPEALAVQEQ